MEIASKDEDVQKIITDNKVIQEKVGSSIKIKV